MWKVYVAGPLNSSGVPHENVQKALDAATELLDLGLYPYVPHLSWYWDQRHPRSTTVWLDLDSVWLQACDAVLRLPGESAGADMEVILANRLGIPVFTSVHELHSHWVASRAA